MIDGEVFISIVKRNKSLYIYRNTRSCFTLSYSGVRHIKIKANNPQQFWSSFFSILVDEHWQCLVSSGDNTTYLKFIRKVSTSTIWERPHPLQRVSWSSPKQFPKQLCIFMWSNRKHPDIRVKLSVAGNPHSRVSLRRRTEANICGNTWLPNASIRASNSDQLRRTVIGFSAMMQVLVWLRSWTCTYAFIWDRFETDSLTQPCSYSKEQNNLIMGQTTWKDLTETLIENRVAQ